MTPDQLNAAATALTPPTGGVASLEAGDDDTDNNSEDGDEGGSTAKPDHMTNGENHMTNGRGHMTVSSSDEGGVSSDDGGSRELTRAEALAALRRRKGKSGELEDRNRSPDTVNGREKGGWVCD